MELNQTQEFSSANSSLKQIPRGYVIVDKYFGWKPNSINLDIGGGRYDLMSDALKEKGVTNLIFDPYNRTKEHNDKVLDICKGSGADTVTIFNVLNVIKEYEIQIEVLNLALELVKDDGMVFIRSTYMNQKKQSGITKFGIFQHYLTMKDYLTIVKRIFPKAEMKYGIIYTKK